MRVRFPPGAPKDMMNNGDYHNVKSTSLYIKKKYGDSPVCRIVGTPLEVWGVSDWRDAGEIIVTVLYRNRMVVEESVSPTGQVYCVDIDGHSELLHESEIGEKVVKPV